MFGFLVFLAFSVSGFSGDLEDGLKAYNNNDYQSAVKLFTKACDGGDASGCYNLGIMYDNGQGVKQDYHQAAKLWTKACDGGHASGCYNLGSMYAKGEGVKQDKQKAKELYGKACDGGDQDGCKYYAFLNQQGY